MPRSARRVKNRLWHDETTKIRRRLIRCRIQREFSDLRIICGDTSEVEDAKYSPIPKKSARENLSKVQAGVMGMIKGDADWPKFKR